MKVKHSVKLVDYFMAITFLMFEACILLMNKLEELLLHEKSALSFEVKYHFNQVRKAFKQAKFHFEFLEGIIIPAMVTVDGQNDTTNVYDAMVTDGYDLARLACRMFNAKVLADVGFDEVENLLKQFETKPQRIDEDVIQSLKLRTYENKGTNTGGGSEAG